MNIKDIIFIGVNIIYMILLARSFKRENYLLEVLDISTRDLCHIKQILESDDTDSKKTK